MARNRREGLFLNSPSFLLGRCYRRKRKLLTHLVRLRPARRSNGKARHLGGIVPPGIAGDGILVSRPLALLPHSLVIQHVLDPGFAFVQRPVLMKLKSVGCNVCEACADLGHFAAARHLLMALHRYAVLKFR